MSDLLALWGVTRDARIVRLDWGTVPPRSSGDVKIRVKNESTQYTAHDVTVSLEDVTAGAAARFLLSLDGNAFTATVNLGDLPATAISAVVWIRRATPSDAATGPTNCQLRVHATAWAAAS